MKVTGVVRRNIVFLVVLVLAGWLFIAAGPPQDEEVPTQPFFPDFFFGRVLVQGSVAPAGLPLVAYIDECDEVYESAPVTIGEDGAFQDLIVNPGDPDLLGHVGDQGSRWLYAFDWSAPGQISDDVE